MKTVIIHGQEIKYESIKSDVEYAKSCTWSKVKWSPTNALVDRKSGSVRTYVGQRFEPKDFEISKTAWTHDHCLICSYRIDNDTTEDVYTDAYNWLCDECYNQFLK